MRRRSLKKKNRVIKLVDKGADRHVYTAVQHALWCFRHVRLDHTKYAYDTARQLASHTGVKLSSRGCQHTLTELSSVWSSCHSCQLGGCGYRHGRRLVPDTTKAY